MKNLDRPLAIVSMQKNEGSLLRAWFHYYRDIVGTENIFLTDNGSDDPLTLEILEELMDAGVSVDMRPARSDFENKGRILFEKATEIFEKGVEWVFFADGDEFLVSNFENSISGSWQSIQIELSRLKAIEQAKIVRIEVGYFNIPGTDRGYKDIFGSRKIIIRKDCPANLELDLGFHLYDWSLREDITKWGVPVKSNFAFIHMHNKEYDSYKKSALSKLSGRIKNFNRETLGAYTGSGAHVVPNLLKSESEYYESFAGKMKNSVSIKKVFESKSIVIPYSDVSLAARDVSYRSENGKANILYAEALELRSNNETEAAIRALKKGFEQFSEFKDSYGHSGFKKELIRSLLEVGRLPEANEVALDCDDNLADFEWTNVLFARAMERLGKFTEARDYWERVLSVYPEHQEASRWKEEYELRVSLILEAPSMPLDCIEILRSCLNSASTYIEYGSGGSTVLAARLGVEQIITVDSDPLWLKLVSNKIISQGYTGKYFPIRIDIGKTIDWGFPKDNERWSEFWRYPFAPWILHKESGLSPEVILIDGRFRVACFFASLIFCKSGTVIFFDDYLDRDYYHCVEEFVKPVEFHGRMAKFIINGTVNSKEIYLKLPSFFEDAR